MYIEYLLSAETEITGLPGISVPPDLPDIGGRVGSSMKLRSLLQTAGLRITAHCIFRFYSKVVFT